jgi:hypothetical protein
MDLKKLIKEVLYGDCCKAVKPTKAPILNESLASREILSEGLKYHIDNKKPLTEHVYRAGSSNYFNLWAEARSLYIRGILDFSGDDLSILTETNLGEFGIVYEIEIGDKVKASKEYGGLSGEVVDIRGSFIVVKTKEGNQSYHESDLRVLNKEGKKVPLDFIFEEESSDFPKTVVVDKETSIKGTQFKIGDIISIQYQFDDDDESFYSIKGYGYNNQNVKILYIPKKKIDNLLKNTSAYLREAKAKKKTPPIGKPMRDSSGGKAYKVYVRDPKTKKIKTVRFGSGGLKAKINNPKARQAFAKRHDCKNKKDRTKPSYWSCRLPSYAKLLGLKSNFSGFW